MTRIESQAVRERMAALPLYLTRAEIALLIGVAVGTLKRWQRSGRFPAPTRRIGRTQRWVQRAVVQWLADGTA